ncbi:MAG: hypothetical protein ACYST0_04585 [Planctomycetota bacterium]
MKSSTKSNTKADALLRTSLLLAGMALPCLCLCQCQLVPAGREVTLRPTDRVVVSYQQGSDGGLQQTLLSQTQVSAQAAYSQKGADPGLKVARLDHLQDLLDEFGRHRFFQKAQPAPPSDVKQLLSVEVNGQSRVFAMLPAHVERNREDLLDFIACKQAFVRVFNLTTGFSSGRTSAADLQKSQAELRERAQRLQEQRQKAAPDQGQDKSQGKSGKR